VVRARSVFVHWRGPSLLYTERIHAEQQKSESVLKKHIKLSGGLILLSAKCGGREHKKEWCPMTVLLAYDAAYENN